MTQSDSPFAFFLGFFERMSPLQELCIGLSAATWLIGGNVLVFYCYRRLGKPWWSMLNPFSFPIRHLNVREQLILLCLAVVSVALFFAATTA